MFTDLVEMDWKLFWQQIYQKAKEVDLFLNAMGLVYTTLLSIIPLLIFSFYIMTLFNFFGKMERIINFIQEVILNNLATGTGQTLINVLERYIHDINQLGVISFASLVVIIIFMLARVEKTFNRIWGVVEHRDLFKRFVAFWTFITLGTFLVTISLSLTISLIRSYFTQDLTGFSNTYLFQFIAFISQLLIFIFGYYLIPNTEVEPLAAVVGGVISGILFNLAKTLYTVYTTNVVTYNQIYGSLSVIPLFLIWLYLIWIIALLGAIIAYVFQHRDYLYYLRDDEQIAGEIRNLVPLAVLIGIYKRFVDKKTTGVTFEELTNEINLPVEIIENSLQKLINAEFISLTKENEYLPLVPLDDISIWKILQVQIFNHQVEVEDIFINSEVKKGYNLIKESMKSDLEELTIADLLD